VNLTSCEIRSVLFGPNGRVEEWNLTRSLVGRAIVAVFRSIIVYNVKGQVR
jgi:hypothetical protein